MTAAEPAGVAGSSAGAAASDDEAVDMNDFLGEAGAFGGGFDLAGLLAGLAAPADGAGAAPGGAFNIADMLAGLVALADGAAAAAAPGAAFNVADMLAELDGGMDDDQP